MRVEVNCTKCKASVLVLDVLPGKPGKDKAPKPDQADLIVKVKAAGWKLDNTLRAVCTDH